MEACAASPELLRLEGVHVGFRGASGVVPVLEGIDLTLRRGETLAIVGESGSGKSVAGLTIQGLLPRKGQITAGRITFSPPGETHDLERLSPRQRRALQGGQIGMIFQQPMTALNPSMRVGAQIVEMLKRHGQNIASREDARSRAAEMLSRTGIPDVPRCMDAYPHQISGGMRQRVMIAMALSCAPALLIADEPTTALDVTTQNKVLGMMRDLCRDMGTSVIFITHDMNVVSRVADRVAVLYAGRVVEEGAVADILHTPMHPYTRGLLACAPRREALVPDARGRLRLMTMPGSVPTPGKRPKGCAFMQRCGAASPVCERLPPAVSGAAAAHQAWCFHAKAVQ